MTMIKLYQDDRLRVDDSLEDLHKRINALG